MLAENNINQPALEYIMNNEELKGYFIHDMSMNAIFTLLGVILQFVSTKRKDNASRIRISK